MRFLGIFCAALLMAHPGPCFVKAFLAGVPDVAADSGCAEDCPQSCPQDDAGRCPLDCQLCVCCSGARGAVPAIALVLSPPRARSMPDTDAAIELRSADLDEVLHVPKPLLA